MILLKRPQTLHFFLALRILYMLRLFNLDLVAVAVEGGLQLVEVLLGETSVLQGIRACSKLVSVNTELSVNTYPEG